jgi:alginate O-acetyltransferase complex protein AlgJ
LPAMLRRLQYLPWAAQLDDYLKNAGSPVRFLDLRPMLLEAKSREPVYWKADTHWNQYGVYVGYRALMQEVRAALPGRRLIVMGPQDFERFWARGAGGDLANMMGVPELYNESFEAMVPRDQTLPSRDPTRQLFEVNGDERGPRLVMFDDSFGNELIPLMARSFSHAAYFWGKHNMSAQFIEVERPDVVIDEFSERFLTGSRWEVPEMTEQSNPH